MSRGDWRRIAFAHARIMWGAGIWVLFVSGEPGAGMPSIKRQIEETYGGICIDMESMAEMSSRMTNAECDERTGTHLWDDIVDTELLDPITEEPVAPARLVFLCTRTSSASRGQ